MYHMDEFKGWQKWISSMKMKWNEHMDKNDIYD
jgi:hypothetical protein